MLAGSQASVRAGPKKCEQTPRLHPRMHCASSPQLTEQPKGDAQLTVQTLPGAQVTAQPPPGHVNEQLSFDAHAQLSWLPQLRST